MDRMGDSKIKIMTDFFGKVNGIGNPEDMLHKLYDIRNNIVHNRKQQTQEFLKKVKIGLLWLEWIMEYFYKTKLGIEQRHESVAAKYEICTLSIHSGRTFFKMFICCLKD